MCENFQLGLAFCRIICSRFWNRVTGKTADPPKEQLSVVGLGFDDSGKTTLLTLLSGQPLGRPEPTTGFKIQAIQLDDCFLNVKEVGGSEKVRPYWKHYYSGAQGVIYFLNSAASSEELSQAADTLMEVLSSDDLRSLPLLIVNNKRDLPGSRNAEEITDLLSLTSELKGRKWMIVEASKSEFNEAMRGFNTFSNLIAPSSEENLEPVNRI